MPRPLRTRASNSRTSAAFMSESSERMGAVWLTLRNAARMPVPTRSVGESAGRNSGYCSSSDLSSRNNWSYAASEMLGRSSA